MSNAADAGAVLLSNGVVMTEMTLAAILSVFDVDMFNSCLQRLLDDVVSWTLAQESCSSPCVEQLSTWSCNNSATCGLLCVAVLVLSNK